MGESPSYKQRLEKRSVQCLSSLYWGPDTSPAPALRTGQREDCRVFSLFFLFLPQQFQASFLLRVQCNCEMSIGQFIPSHPAAPSPDAVDVPPASLHPAPARRSQAPAPSAEPHSSSTSHAPTETVDDTLGGVTKPTVGSGLFAQTRLWPLTASRVHRS